MYPSSRNSLTVSPEQSPSCVSKVDGIADSGAQLDVWSLDEYVEAGFLIEQLQPAVLSLTASNKSLIHIDGAFFTTITGIKTYTGKPINCNVNGVH